MKHWVQVLIFALLTLAVLFFIFYNSAQPRETSASFSEKVVKVTKPIVDPKDKIPEPTFHHYVRKTAHFTEYAALGFCYMGLSDGFLWQKRRRLRWILPIAAAALTAAVDELSQFLSIDRGPGVRDVLLDTVGAAFGVAVLLILARLIAKRMKR